MKSPFFSREQKEKFTGNTWNEYLVTRIFERLRALYRDEKYQKDIKHNQILPSFIKVYVAYFSLLPSWLQEEIYSSTLSSVGVKIQRHVSGHNFLSLTYDAMIQAATFTWMMYCAWNDVLFADDSGIESCYDNMKRSEDNLMCQNFLVELQADDGNNFNSDTYESTITTCLWDYQKVTNRYEKHYHLPFLFYTFWNVLDDFLGNKRLFNLIADEKKVQYPGICSLSSMITTKLTNLLDDEHAESASAFFRPRVKKEGSLVEMINEYMDSYIHTNTRDSFRKIQEAYMPECDVYNHKPELHDGFYAKPCSLEGYVLRLLHLKQCYHVAVWSDTFQTAKLLFNNIRLTLESEEVMGHEDPGVEIKKRVDELREEISRISKRVDDIAINNL
jgi:hypothetical protein